MKKIRLRFWGVRGSTPSPSSKTLKYGGNTPCMEINYGNEKIVCDAGTGIRELGLFLSKKSANLDLSLLISHVHWDHISGLPFFLPLYSAKNTIKIIGPRIKGSLKHCLQSAISPPYFPVNLKDVPSRLKIIEIGSKSFMTGTIKVVPFRLNHPGGAAGWRFEFSSGKAIVYVSDNEPQTNDGELIKWLQNADVLIHEAQYIPAEYKKKKGWGHSPYTYPVKLAEKAGIKKLILNHYDPTYTDDKLDKINLAIQKIIKNKKLRVKCEMARERKQYSI